MRTGDVIDGRFQLGGLIGSGGIGEVFEAVDLTTGAPCALKCVRPHLARESRIRRRFMREARAVSRLQHPHIVSLIAYGGADDVPYIAMERLHGRSLGTLRDAPVPLALLLRLVDQCLAALAYSHARGVIHRDFKPDNVMVLEGPDGPWVKLLDFGFARVEEDDDPDLTQVHRDAFGTPHYMAPEQANGDGPVGPPTDLYAVGAVLYELCAGAPPFQAPTPMAVIVKQIMEPVPPLIAREGLAVPDGLIAVIGRALAKAARDRFDTANDMRRALAPFALQAAQAASAGEGARPAVAAAGVQTLAPVARPRTPPDLVGREAELDWLWAQARSTSVAGEGRVLLLAGAPGIGRLALMDWLCDAVAEGGWMRVVRGVTGVDADLGHAALRGTLEQLFGPLPRGVREVAEAVSDSVARWQRARGRAGGVADRLEVARFGALAEYLRPTPGAARALSGDALCARTEAAFALAAAERPVLWVIDSLDDAGPALLQCLQWLAQSLEAPTWPLLIVAGHSGEAAPEGVRALAALPRVSQRGLDALPVRVMAQRLAGAGHLGADLAHVLAAASGGNPLFAWELLAVLHLRAALVDTDGGWALAPGADPRDWPTSLAEAAVERLLGALAALPDPLHAERTLLSAGVLGEAFDYQLLVDFMARSGADGRQTEAAIEALLQAELLIEVRDWRLDRLRFAHGGLWRAARTAAAQRGLPLGPLHRLAIEAKQALGGEAHADVLAAHAEVAGASLQAAGFLEQAAARALAGGEVALAGARLARAQALMAKEAGPEVERRCAWLRLAMADVDLAAGRHAEARARVDQVEAWARTHRDLRLAARVRMVVGRLLVATDRAAHAVGIFDQAVQLFGRADRPRAQAEALLDKADVALGLGDEAGAEAALSEARGLLRTQDAVALTARAHLGLGRLALRRGAAGDAQGLLTQALEGFTQAADWGGRGRCWQLLAEAAAQQQQPAMVEAHLEEALGAFAALGDLAGLAQAHRARAEAHADRGQWDAAFEHLEAGVEAALEIGDLAGAAAARRTLGRRALAAGEAGLAQGALEAALGYAVSTDAPEGQAGLFALAGWAAGATGQIELYRARLRRAWQLASQPAAAEDAELAGALEGAGQLAAARGDVRAAARLLQRAVAQFAAQGDAAAAERLGAQVAALGVGRRVTSMPPPVVAPSTAPPLDVPAPQMGGAGEAAAGPEAAALPAWVASPPEASAPAGPAAASRPGAGVDRPTQPERAPADAPQRTSTRVVGDSARRGPVTGTLVIGRRIGNLKIVEPIASGGMGTVYRAEHVGLGTPYAIKLLHAALVEDPNVVARFRREAVACSRLRHPNIVFLTDFGLDPELGLYLVMEYLEGEPLSARLRRTRQIAVGEAITWAQQISLALLAAHEQGVVHRDLKPENLFLVSDGAGGTRVKVLDFGIARIQRADDEEQARLTQAGLVLGTPDYMSPEQINGKDELLGPPTDIYALGAILFQMVAGRPPFTAANEIKVLSEHLLTAAPRLSSARSDLGATRLEALVDDMLHKAPVGRPASMAVVSERLAEALRELRALGVRDAGTATSPRLEGGDDLLARLRAHDPQGLLAQLMGALPGLGELPLSRQQIVVWGVVQRVALDAGPTTRSFRGAAAQAAELLGTALAAAHGEGDEESLRGATRGLASLLRLATPAQQKLLVLAVQPLRGRPGFPEVALPAWARISGGAPGADPWAGGRPLAPSDDGRPLQLATVEAALARAED